MNILVICLFIAALLPYLAKLPVVYAMQKAGGHNNNYPRLQQSQLTGFGARAVGAHQNSFESLLIFSTAAITALATNHLSSWIEGLAIFYLVSRVVYYFLYYMDIAGLRTLVWALGYIACLAILALCF